MKKKVVVIGAGVGGSACAALFAVAGHDVTLLERHGFSGGRCSTFSRDGLDHDFGVHMFSRGERGPHGEANRRLGGNLKWVRHDPSSRVMGRTEFDFPLSIKTYHRQYRLAKNLGVKTKNYTSGYRLLNFLFKGRHVTDYDGVRLSDLVKRYTDDERIHLFINCLSQLYFALSYDQASAGEFIWCFSKMFNNASFGYPIGGCGRIAATYIEALERAGGTVVYHANVDRIRIEGQRARGVETRRQTYPADLVVSSAGLGATVKLAGEANFPGEYLKRVAACRHSNAYVTIKYRLQKAVISHPVVFYLPALPADRVFEYLDKREVPDDPYIFMPVPTNQDPALSIQGHQLIIAGAVAPPGASQELSNAILDSVHRKVCELFPELEGHLVTQTRSTCRDVTRITGHPEGEAMGIGQFPDQVGARRPASETPVEGLFLVGADAGARGVGTEMAVGSALLLADRFA